MLLIQFLYLLALVVWMGSILFFSLIAAPSIFKVLTPESAGKLVSAIFPKYYPIGYISGLVALGCSVLSWFKTGHWPYIKMIVLVLMTTLTIFNALVTYPKAKSLKEEMKIASSQTEQLHIKEVFEHTHRLSMINNGLVLILGIFLIFLTALRLTI